MDKAVWDELVENIIEDFKNYSKESGERTIRNYMATLSRYKRLYFTWSLFSNHLLMHSSLPERDRELIILRIGWLCQAEYEWGQHVLRGKMIGLSEVEIERIKDGPNVEGWDFHDAVLIRAVDELYSDAIISDPTWNNLIKKYDTDQLMDLVFTVGQYNMVAMAFNTFGVQLDENIKGF
ncbi:MAG TPA: carboxymuconolactone decarboxylase family protein [archaeon]|nr:carboxymuconolactone decarboxylase family protein [archaeon]